MSSNNNVALTQMVQAAVQSANKISIEPLLLTLTMYIKENTKAIEEQTKQIKKLEDRIYVFEEKLSMVIKSALEDEAKIELSVTLQDVRANFFNEGYFFAKLKALKELFTLVSLIR